MKKLTTAIICILLSINLFAQEDKVKELVQQGVDLHDLGKYNEAIAKYKAALDIDSKSNDANYEISYTYMSIGDYDNAIKYSSKVIKQNTTSQPEAYVVLGSSYDLIGKPQKAIKTYEEGIEKYPNIPLLHYNLALTCYNTNDYDKAEIEAQKSISLNPNHGTSHIILAAIMQAKGFKIKAALPLYYFLMIEPNSGRSAKQLPYLKNILNQGISKKDDNHINVNLSLGSMKDKEFGSTETMLSLFCSTRYTKENEKVSDYDFFVKTTERLFSSISELKKEQTGWWDIYVSKFAQIKDNNQIETFCYYISQTDKSDDIIKWLTGNKDKIAKMHEWIDKK